MFGRFAFLERIFIYYIRKSPFSPIIKLIINIESSLITASNLLVTKTLNNIFCYTYPFK